MTDFFPEKILKGNKSDLNRRFNKRFHPGLKPLIFRQYFANFQFFSRKMRIVRPFFWVGWEVSYLNIFHICSSFLSIIMIFFNIIRNNVRFSRSLNRKPDRELKSRYPRVLSNIQQIPSNFASKPAFHSRIYILFIFVGMSLIA